MLKSGISPLLSPAANDIYRPPASPSGAERLVPLRHVYNALAGLLNRPLRVLELNCGEGFLGLHLAAWGATVIGIDSSAENIARAQEAARGDAGLPVQFLAIPMKAILDTVKPDDFDLIVDFSFHKWIYSYGFAWARQALAKIGAKSAAGLFAVDLEAVYSDAIENPEKLFADYAFMRVIDDTPQLYFASNRMSFENGRCGTLSERQTPRDRFRAMYDTHNGSRFRAPADLSVTLLPLKRVLLVGTCLVARWVDVITNAHDGCTCDQVLFGLSMPPDPPQPSGNYDFQVVQIPLRYLLPDQKLFRLPGADADECQKLFDETAEALRHYLDTGLHWNKRDGLLSFVANFLVPQQNPAGRLLPRNDLRNPVFFVEQLNACLDREIARYQNVYRFDIEQIAAGFGKRYIQDDHVYQWTHAGELGDCDHPYDRQRIEPPAPMTLHYRNETPAFIHTVWAELIAAYRTIRQIDMVKLVVIDLDDTLWRGVLAETDGDDPWMLEGWPLGFIEALLYLKARGVLLAIISKNEEDRIVGLWDRVMGRLMRLDDFAIRKINRRSKADNLEDILKETNLLPRNVIFIDDNPVERAAVEAAFPDVRVLGAHIYYLRRILLWAPETQTVSLSSEAGRRTEMMQAQMERETQRKRMSREEFLASLGLKVRLRRIADARDEKFPRAFELLNKTNQFNTTGQRWTHAECVELFAKGGFFCSFDAEDRFTSYGLVGVIICAANNIEQMVMSCRVAGLDIELAAMAGAIAMINQPMLRARIIETDANFLARDLYERCGFKAAGGGDWTRSSVETMATPAHIVLTGLP